MKGLTVLKLDNPRINFMQTIELKLKVNSNLNKFIVDSRNISILIKYR